MEDVKKSDFRTVRHKSEDIGDYQISNAIL